MRDPLLAPLAESYLKVQKSRLSIEARLRAARKKGILNQEEERVLEHIHSTLLALEKEIMKTARERLRDHPLWDWCKNVKGLGPMAALIFLGYVDVEKATSAGKVWKLFGLAVGPDGKAERKRHGKVAGFNPHLKTRAWLMARNIIMNRDPYYYQLYLERKRYYETRPDRVALKEKERGWHKHNHLMAMRWMIKLVLSHMLEICRRYLGLPFPRHRNYIPPKPIHHP